MEETKKFVFAGDAKTGSDQQSLAAYRPWGIQRTCAASAGPIVRPLEHDDLG
jgi:hypothetical protein